MRKDNVLEKRINELREKYSLFSRENNMVSEVSFWIRDVVNSAIPDSVLAVVEGKIDEYSNNLKYNPNKHLIKSLKEIIESSRNKYVNKIHREIK